MKRDITFNRERDLSPLEVKLLLDQATFSQLACWAKYRKENYKITWGEIIDGFLYIFINDQHPSTLYRDYKTLCISPYGKEKVL